MSDFINPMHSPIKVIDNTSNSIMAYFKAQENDLAYQYAMDLESYGLDVRIEQIGAPESLALCISNDPSVLEQFAQSADDEIKNHD